MYCNTEFLHSQALSALEVGEVLFPVKLAKSNTPPSNVEASWGLKHGSSLFFWENVRYCSEAS